jgi:hypothetical protein
VLVALSLWVPPVTITVTALAADGVKQEQLERLAELREELQQANLQPEVEELVKQLETISEQFERGVLSPRGRWPRRDHPGSGRTVSGGEPGVAAADS